MKRTDRGRGGFAPQATSSRPPRAAHRVPSSATRHRQRERERKKRKTDDTFFQDKLCDSDTLDEQLHKILDSADGLAGPIKELIQQTEGGSRSEAYDQLDVMER